jgi:Icc-related predicted phosphoesterase
LKRHHQTSQQSEQKNEINKEVDIENTIVVNPGATKENTIVFVKL